MFSITQQGKELDKSKYSWNEKTRTLSTKENYLVLDFSDYNNVTFKTGSNCTFNTRSSCTFKTGDYCTFYTSHGCTFKTGSYCIFHTGYSCTLKTGDTCTFTTGAYCTFNTGENCVAIRYDVIGITVIPKNITIQFNSSGVSGYTKV
jgi:hypothetical protein